MSAVETNQTAATVPPAYKPDFKIGQRVRILNTATVTKEDPSLVGLCGQIFLIHGPYFGVLTDNGSTHLLHDDEIEFEENEGVGK